MDSQITVEELNKLKEYKICNKNLSDTCIKVGHISMFRPKTNTCKECLKIKNRQFYNPEKHKIIYQNKRDQYIERAKQRYQKIKNQANDHIEVQ
jgi:hypothetical protein